MERKGAVSHNSILADLLHVLASRRLHRLPEFTDIWMHNRYRGENVPDNERACVGKTSSKTLKHNYRRMFNVISQATQPTSRIPWGRQEKITQPKIFRKETSRLHLINADVETCSPVIL
jgi:hypothetical protein